MVQGGMTLVKYVLFLFNALFVIFGITLVVLGSIAVNSVKYVKPEFDLGSLMSAGILVILLGLFIFFLSFLGCCGAIKESHCMVMTYSVILLLIVILEFAAAITAFVFKDKIEKSLKDVWSKQLEKCKDHINSTNACDPIDALQSDFKCCGIEGASDWGDKLKNIDSCFPDKSKDPYPRGCFSMFKDTLKKNALTIGIVGLIFTFIELVGVIFGCCLSRSIRLQYEVV